jgi:two-component system chemotaxis sensor kinase CheA
MSLLDSLSVDTFDNEFTLEQFVIQVPIVKTAVEGQCVKDIFHQLPEAEGVIVMENNCPAGIIMRTTFYQKMGTLYGHSLYSNRPVRILMETDFMRVNIDDSVSTIGIQSMNREPGKLYDYIVVYKNNTYFGVISIRIFLMELSKRNEAQITVLKNQQQKLLNAHEQEVLLRKDLEYQSDTVCNLLDHADQGFFWFDKDLIIKKECSHKCMSIFRKSIGGCSYLDLVTQYFEADKRDIFQMVFENYFKNNSPVSDNVYLMLLPADCIILGKSIHFEYRRIDNNGQKAVMVILNDITERINLEKAMENDRNKQRLIIKAFSCQAQIKQMLEEFHEIFSGGYQNFFQENRIFSDCLNELFRVVHTFKGDFAQYGFISTANHVHEFEEKLLAVVSLNEKASLADVENIMTGIDPDRILKDDINIIREVLGNAYFDQSEMIAIPKSKLLDIEKRLRSGSDNLDQNTVIQFVKNLKRKNIKIYLEQYRDYLQYLSGRVLKNMPVYLVEGDDVEIDGDQYGDFLKALVHIFRNFMDHGLETDEERLEFGKSERGVMECQISKLDDRWFTICLSDDGRGLDLNKIKNKAIENHLFTVDEINRMNKSEICNLVFADHFSTKDCADMLSGRGVGMSAFQKTCIDLGGKVEIKTEEKKGTAFLVTLPYSE